jgi:hypothetical protein
MCLLLARTTCNKRYIGQTGRPFHTRYKEHEVEYRYCTQKSNFAKHLLEEKHPFPPINDCMKVLQHFDKGPMLNTVEKFYNYKATAINSQLNDMGTVASNAIFDNVLHQYTGNADSLRP